MSGVMRSLAALGLLATLAACAPTQTKEDYDYSAFRAEDPRSILIVPAVNRSVEVDAPDFFLSTISRPAAERGYYIFPVHMVKRVLEDDGLADAYMVHQQDPVLLAELFGADAVLYVVIEQWNAKYVVLSTQVTVELSYSLKSGKTGEELWSSRIARTYDSGQGQSSSGSLLGDLIVSAVMAGVEKAKPNYVPLSQQANSAVTQQDGRGVPYGPYHSKYGQEFLLAPAETKPADTGQTDTEPAQSQQAEPEQGDKPASAPQPSEE